MSEGIQVISLSNSFFFFQKILFSFPYYFSIDFALANLRTIGRVPSGLFRRRRLKLYSGFQLRRRVVNFTLEREMGGKGLRRRERNYRAAHGGYDRLPPPPNASQVDTLPSKLRKLMTFTSPRPQGLFICFFVFICLSMSLFNFRL